MKRHLKDLCEILENELERQENLLTLLNDQREALLVNDTEALHARTNSINTLVAEAAAAESARHAVLRELVKHFDLGVNEQTMSTLISHMPSPWSDRMEFVQKRLQKAMSDSHRLVYENARMLRRSNRVAGDSIVVLTGQDKAAPASYAANGSGTPTPMPSNVINRLG